MKEMQITVIKVGGAVVEDAAALSALLDSFAAVGGAKVLVHGGGRRATKVAAQLGIETRMVGGRRITDAAMLDVVTMVYGGLVNKRVVAALQARGVNALGLCGADCDIIRSHRRAVQGGVDYGFVGDVDRADGPMLARLLAAGITPVVAPLTHDGAGTLLNTNADTMAQAVATALAATGADVRLVYGFEKAGVLRDPDDDGSVIARITAADFRRLADDGTISGGMLPKVENALAAVKAGVRSVVITRADRIADPAAGTTIE